MLLEYISHSCFVIESQGTRLAFDPWITGSAYGGQWHLFPKPVDTSNVINADAILISHGHEDHLHNASLKLISKKARIFFPFQWRKGIMQYLNHLGFSSPTEAVSFRTYDFRGIKITYLGFSLESVIVVEAEGKVIVNINDALNSNHETAVDFLLEKIKKRWPKIDYLLSGWSGAGYFPNKVHYKGKDDVLIGKLREQYFANNFCRFTHYLQPKIAVAFSPGFVLLNEENRWINDVKFPRQLLSEYYSEHFEKNSGIEFPVTFPGDRIADGKFIPVSKYHSVLSDDEIYKDVNELFSEEITASNMIDPATEKDLGELEQKLIPWMNKNASLYHKNVIADSFFSLQFTDAPGKFFNIIPGESGFSIIRSAKASPDDRLIIRVKAKLVSKNLDKPWGGDLLSIGYGIDVTVFEELSLEKNLDIVCVRLISRFPIFKDDYIKNPGRILKYYLSNPALTNLWIDQKLKLKPYVNKYPFNERDHWITYNKCELCKVCKMPELEMMKTEAN